MTAAHLLLAIRHKEITGELTGDQGIKLLIAWNAIRNREAAQIAYEDHLRETAQNALRAVNRTSAYYDLETLGTEILDALGLVMEAG